MNTNQIIGIAIVTLPFLALFFHMWKTEGIGFAFSMFAASTASSALILTGIRLFTSHA